MDIGRDTSMINAGQSNDDTSINQSVTRSVIGRVAFSRIVGETREGGCTVHGFHFDGVVTKLMLLLQCGQHAVVLVHRWFACTFLHDSERTLNLVAVRTDL